MEIEKIEKKFIELTKSLGFKKIKVKVEKDPKVEILSARLKSKKIRKNIIDCKLLVGKYFNKYTEKLDKFLGHEIGHMLFFRDHFYLASLVHVIGTPFRKSNYALISFLPYLCYWIGEEYANYKASKYGLKTLTIEEYQDLSRIKFSKF